LKQDPYVRQIRRSLLAVKYDITLNRETYSLYVFIVFFFIIYPSQNYRFFYKNSD
jgi:hypothetical protein